jgi:Uncharacterised protein family (UPF0172)
MVESTTKGENKTAIVSPQATLAIALHCNRHSTDSVHGILLGKVDSNDGIVSVSDAVPVTHGAPTTPIVESAFGLLPHCLKDRNAAVVGWYTAPMLLQDTRPGPLALRIVANLGTMMPDSILPVVNDPILIVVQNEVLASAAHGALVDDAVDSVFKAFGKNSGNQWLSPIDSVKVERIEDVSSAILKANEGRVAISDLLDFYDECSAPASSQASWFPSDKVAELLLK